MTEKNAVSVATIWNFFSLTAATKDSGVTLSSFPFSFAYRSIIAFGECQTTPSMAKTFYSSKWVVFRWLAGCVALAGDYDGQLAQQKQIPPLRGTPLIALPL